MIFNRDHVALIRQGKLTAALVPATSKLKAGHVQALQRRFMRHDDAGAEIGTAIETVADQLPDGDRITVILTILAVTTIALSELTQQDAQACGYKTLTGARDAWSRQHNTLLCDVKLVRFAVGDLRDRDLYLTHPVAGRGGDYTTQRHLAIDELPVLAPAQLAPFTAQARARDQARRKQADADAKNLSLGDRLGRLDDARQRQRLDISREMRVIEQRVDRAERLLDD